jgi:hypothetical protein
MRPTSLWALAAAVALAGCGGGGPTQSAPTVATVRPSTTTPTGRPSATTPTVRPTAPPKPPPPAYPQLLPAATAHDTTGFVPAVTWQGRTAAWIARTSTGMTLMSFDQQLVELRLHAGAADPGGSGWRFGASVSGAELSRLVAAFNGAFKLSTGSGGYESYNHVAAPLTRGLGSIVTYSDGTTDIGTWGSEVPSGGRAVVSVRQNLQPLIDNGKLATNAGCRDCWGATLGGVPDPARAGLGVTADGRLVWAASEHITASDLGAALLKARVVRAVELDINPEWVAGYLYGHRGGHGPLAPVPALGTQQGIPGQFLAPWSRDFFAIDAR